MFSNTFYTITKLLCKISEIPWRPPAEPSVPGAWARKGRPEEPLVLKWQKSLHAHLGPIICINTLRQCVQILVLPSKGCQHRGHVPDCHIGKATWKGDGGLGCGETGGGLRGALVVTQRWVYWTVRWRFWVINDGSKVNLSVLQVQVF